MQFLYHDEYALNISHDERVNLLGLLAGATFDRLTQGTSASPSQFANEMSPALGDKDLTMWFATAAEQHFAVRIGGDGSVARGRRRHVRADRAERGRQQAGCLPASPGRVLRDRRRRLGPGERNRDDHAAQRRSLVGIADRHHRQSGRLADGHDPAHHRRLLAARPRVGDARRPPAAIGRRTRNSGEMSIGPTSTCRPAARDTSSCTSRARSTWRAARTRSIGSRRCWRTPIGSIGRCRSRRRTGDGSDIVTDGDG